MEEYAKLVQGTLKKMRDRLYTVPGAAGAVCEKDCDSKLSLQLHLAFMRIAAVAGLGHQAQNHLPDAIEEPFPKK